MVNVAIRFLTNEHDEVNVRADQSVISRWITKAIGRDDESQRASAVLHKWFSIRDLKRFTAGYETRASNNNEAERITALHREWARGISFTPTFFMNGFQLSDEYSIDDMMVLIPALADDIG